MKAELQKAAKLHQERGQELEQLSEEELRERRDQVVTAAVMNIDMPVPPSAEAPKAKENMIRSHVHLRRDQIEFLDRMADSSGPGVHRSDWIRYAIDRLKAEVKGTAGSAAPAGKELKP